MSDFIEEMSQLRRSRQLASGKRGGEAGWGHLLQEQREAEAECGHQHGIR